MDNRRFDALTRSLMTARSRRGVVRILGGLVSGAVPLAILGQDVEAAKLKGGARCTRGSDCKTGKCLSPGGCRCRKSSCRCKCSCSNTDPIVGCKQPADPCKQAVCSDSGACVIEDVTCPGEQVCCKGACVDLRSDPNNCGRCGHSCPAGLCYNGACGCSGLPSDCPEGCTCATRTPLPNSTAACGGTDVACQDQTPCPNGDSDCPLGSTCGQPCSNSDTTRRCIAECTA